MPFVNRQDYVIIDLIQQAVRNVKAQPLNLGGFGGAGGGEGKPPGGFIGRLPQYQVTYDETEAATLDTLPSGLTGASGWSLVDNLNHIRYRLEQLEAGSGVLVVDEYDGNPTVNPTTRITFSGALVTDLGGGRALVAFSGGVGGAFDEEILEDTIHGLAQKASPSISDFVPIIDTFGGDDLKKASLGDVYTAFQTAQNGSLATSRVVVTDSSVLPELDTLSWLGYDSGNLALEFGAGVGGKETNAGKVSYEGFGAGYLHIVGAGTTGGNRKVKLYDKSYCDLFVGGIQIPGMTSTVMLGTDSSNNIIDNTSTGDARWAPVGVYGEGWVPRTETWTRTGNFTFTLSADYTHIYRKGVRVQYVDSGGGPDYGVILSATHSAGTTTVTLYSNNDYAMAAGSITNTYISYQASPRFFPQYFTFTPSNFAASGSMTVSLTTTTMAKFLVDLMGIVDGFVQVTVTTGGTTSTQIVCDSPSTVLDTNSYPSVAATLDGGSATIVALGVVNGNSILGSANRLQWRKSDNSNWGIGAGRILQMHFQYPS